MLITNTLQQELKSKVFAEPLEAVHVKVMQHAYVNVFGFFHVSIEIYVLFLSVATRQIQTDAEAEFLKVTDLYLLVKDLASCVLLGRILPLKLGCKHECHDGDLVGDPLIEAAKQRKGQFENAENAAN